MDKDDVRRKNLRNIADDPRHLEYSAQGGHNSQPTKARIRTAKAIAAAISKSKLPINVELPVNVKEILQAESNGKHATTNLEAVMGNLFGLAISGEKGSVEATKLLLQLLGEDVADKQEIVVKVDSSAGDIMG